MSKLLSLFCPLSVSYPRQVTIYNTRLAICHSSIAIALFAYLLRSFIQSQGWLTPKPAVGYVSVFPKGWKNETSAKLANERDAQLDFCKNPQRYEYCDSADCELHLKPAGCKEICVSGSNRATCTNFVERWALEGDGKGLFLPTYLDETLVLVDEVGEVTQGKNMNFLTGIQDMGIGFEIAYEVEDLRGNVIRGSSKAGAGEGGDLNQRDLRVRLQHHTGEIMYEWQPGETMLSVTIDDLFEAAGIDLEKGMNGKAGKNFAPGAQIEDGVLLRLSGFELFLTMKFHGKNTRGQSWTDPVCTITVRIEEQYATREETTQIDMRGSVRNRYFYGVRLQFETRGSFFYPDESKIFAFLASLIVFMGAAKKISEYFTIYVLGDLSTVYKKFIYQAVSLDKCLISLAMRLLSHSMVFEDEMEDSPDGINRSHLHAIMRRVFKSSSGLGEEELKSMTGYLYEHVLQGDECNMTIGDFGEACSELEPIDKKMLTKFFQVSDGRTILERFFADDTVRKLLNKKEVQKRSIVDEEDDMQEKEKGLTKLSKQCSELVLMVEATAKKKTRNDEKDKRLEEELHHLELEEHEIHEELKQSKLQVHRLEELVRVQSGVIDDLRNRFELHQRDFEQRTADLNSSHNELRTQTVNRDMVNELDARVMWHFNHIVGQMVRLGNEKPPGFGDVEEFFTYDPRAFIMPPPPGTQNGSAYDGAVVNEKPQTSEATSPTSIT